MNKIGKHIVVLFLWGVIAAVQANLLLSDFQTPPKEARPETWFHLIGGNVSKPGLTADLTALSEAGFEGIQLFHGSGRAWPNVKPQITCLSDAWEDMIGHVVEETQRLGLRFTMQNCPGWAMSGGPWITPDKAMRHLIWSRRDIEGGHQTSIQLPRPEPASEPWRDYRDVAVLAFPTPADDIGEPLIPIEISSNRKTLPWEDLIRGKKNTKIRINPDVDSTWLEVRFSQPVNIRSIELPPVESLMLRRNFNPDSAIRVQALTNDGLSTGMRREIPRGNWQDRLPEICLPLAFSDQPASEFRITFENNHPMQLTYMRLFSAARVNDWRGQAGYALRSLDRSKTLVQDPAAWLKAKDIIDLSNQVDSSGQLTWKPPAGKWTIVRLGHVNTGVKNKPAPPEATGFECNKLSPSGADQHFAGYIGKVTAPGGPADGGRLKGMLIDSWECYTQTWTGEMEKEFAARRGYALRPWLPALAGWVIQDHLTTERFLRDWRATISDLLVENYFGRLTELAKQRGLKLSFETALGDVSPGDILQYYSKADIPMCEFWQPNDPHWGGLETKPIAPAASAAHIYGKQRIAAESFTNVGLRWNEHPFMLKHMADFHFTQGINHLVFHTYTHNPDLNVVPGTSFGGRIGTPFLRGQTWWRHIPLFIDYLSRCQYILEQGRPVADVLWYLGDDLNHKPTQDSPFPIGYKFDYLNQDALIHRITVVDGMLQTPEGLSWKVLWLPDAQCQRLTPETLKCLHQILIDGATVIGAGPLENATLTGGAVAAKEFSSLVNQLWGQNPASRGDRRIGRGRLLWGESLSATLSQLGIRPDVVGASTATWCHRQVDETEVYFVAASRDETLEANIRFQAKGHPELWDPMTGTKQAIAVYQRQGDYTAIPLNLPAAGSVFVVFRNGPVKPSLTKIIHNGSTLTDAAKPANQNPPKARSIYGLTKQDELQPWVNTPLAACERRDGKNRFVAWENGVYEFIKADGDVIKKTVHKNRSIDCAGPWQLSFPSGWDTPSTVKLPRLMPWSELKDPATRAFSGSATYSCAVNLESPEKDTRLLLDLGRVSVIAEIAVNGTVVTTMWTPPFRADITSYVKEGDNRIDITVTNTWYNRLIYDASLPKARRKTWTYNAPAADAPLEKAGLEGPVRIYIGKEMNINLESGPEISDQPEVDLVFGDYQQLMDRKNKFQNNDPDVQSAYQIMIRRADHALDQKIASVTDKKRIPPSGDKRDYLTLAPYWWPDPQKADGLPYIRRDGRVNPKNRGEHTDYATKERFFNHVKMLGMAAFYTEDRRYADIAVAWLRTWFVDPSTRMNPHLEYAQGVPGLNEGRCFGIIEWADIDNLITPIQLLRTIDAIPKSTDQAITKWFEEYLEWLQTSEKGQLENSRSNNHATWYDVQVLGILLFLGKNDEAHQILENVKSKRIATQIEPDGRQPHELARTKSLSYSKMNLSAFKRLANLGNKVGVDLWDYETPDGRSIRKAQEFLDPYLRGDKKWKIHSIEKN